MNNKLKYIKSEQGIIVPIITLFFILIICILTDPLYEFGMNLIPEVLVTVFAIDRIQKYREDKRTRPLRLAAYEDIRLFITIYANFWQDLYRKSVPEEEPETIEQFFSANGMGRIWENLYIRAKVDYSKNIFIKDYISVNAQRFRDQGNRILNRHASSLNPTTYKNLHTIIESWFIEGLIGVPEMTIRMKNSPALSILYSFCSAATPTIEDYKASIELIKWCEIEKKELVLFDPDIKNVFVYSAHTRDIENLEYMIPSEILKKEIQEIRNSYR